MHALIASGTGRYADPWHPFPRTSPLLAATLTAAGFTVAIEDDIDHAMTRLDDVDVLVVNAGDPWRDVPKGTPRTAVPADALTAALARGMGVLALHCAVASLRDYPDWAPALGAMWIPGSSYHPPASTTVISGISLPGTGPLPDIELFDERYCRLQPTGTLTPVAWHSGDTTPEPAAWVREYSAARIAVDLLGHDERSYAAPGHRTLLAALARWCAPIG
ncbi:MAG: ThuA domain-containing protein [Propioniciclava sp.]